MSFLPTDFVRLRTLRRGAALKLLALPYVAVLAAIALWPKGQHILPTSVASHVGSLLSVSPEQVESTIVAVVVVVLLIVGYLLGWGLNATILAMSKSYGISQALDIVAKGKLPASWQNEKASEILAAADEKLSQQRAFATKIGPLRFIVLRGGLLFGALAFVLMHIALNLVQSQPIVLSSLPWKFCFWVALGMFNAAWSWYELTRVTPAGT